MFRAVFALLLLITVSSCQYYDVAGRTIDVRLDRVDLKKLFDGIASDICAREGDAQADKQVKNEPLVVTDFMNLSYFEPKKTGLVLAEMMRGSLSKQCNSRIIQGEFSKYLKLSDKGFVVLTRSVDEVKNQELTARQIVVGTYESNGNKLLIFVKNIDMSTGIAEKVITRELEFYQSAVGTLEYRAK